MLTLFYETAGRFFVRHSLVDDLQYTKAPKKPSTTYDIQLHPSW